MVTGNRGPGGDTCNARAGGYPNDGPSPVTNPRHPPPTNNPSDDSKWSFFFNDTATPEIYTLSLHDALPISFPCCWARLGCLPTTCPRIAWSTRRYAGDRKSTRLNSSHDQISDAVFFLKKFICVLFISFRWVVLLWVHSALTLYSSS